MISGVMHLGSFGRVASRITLHKKMKRNGVGFGVL
jgi:hypothetical protein